YHGRVVITRNGVLNGGSIDGYVRNSGLVTGDLHLGPGSTLDGGQVSGVITGHPDIPARILNAHIATGTRLENVVIGPGTTLAPGVLLGPNVRFDSAAIPPGIDLRGALAGLHWTSGDA